MTKNKNNNANLKDNPLIDFIIGGFSGAVSKTVIAPLERTKMII